QFGDDFLVRHRFPGIGVDRARVEMQGEVDQVFDLARRQAGGLHVVDLELEHVGGTHAPRQLGEPVPNRLRGLYGNLLAHDAARQCSERIAAGLQAGIAELRDQPLHHAVLAGQVTACFIPVAGRGEQDLGRNGAQDAASQVVPDGESLSTTPCASSSLRIRSASAKFFAFFAAARCWIKPSIVASSSAVPARKNSLGSPCRMPRHPPSAFSRPASCGDLPRLTSAASSNSTATASGVAKSLSIAALNFAAGGCDQSTCTSAGATRSSAVYSRLSAPR